MKSNAQLYKIYCSQCSSLLLEAKTFCFFKQDQNIHLMIKPNVLGVKIPFDKTPIDEIAYAPFLKKTNIVVKPNPNPQKSKLSPFKLFCKKGCAENIGGVLKLGPAKEPVFCLSARTNKAHGCIIQPYPKNFPAKSQLAGWGHGYHPFLGDVIGTRNYDDFYYGDEIPENIEIDSITNKAPKHPERHQMRYSGNLLRDKSLKDLESININDLTFLSPRGYQLECLFSALLDNTLVCLPTGTGKSLISYMFLKRMMNINKRKLSVFLAPKIVLVQQQKEKFKYSSSHREEKNLLKVFSLTGDCSVNEKYEFLEKLYESMTSSKEEVSQFVLFATSQYFLNLLDEKFIWPEDICAVVFDEAHNSEWDSPYFKILDKLIASGNAPAILPLTASPAGAETLEATRKKLEEVCNNFKSRCFTPSIFLMELEDVRNKIEIEEKIIKPTMLEKEIEESITFYLSIILPEFYDQPTNINLSKRTLAFIDLKATKIRSDLKNIHNFMDNHLKMIIEIYFYNKKLGSQKSIPQLEACLRWTESRSLPNKNLFRDFFAHYLTKENKSRQSSSVTELCKILNEHFENSEKMDSDDRALVFVEERATAKWLGELLAADPLLSSFNPAYLFGQGGVDGMSWEEMHKPVLDRFEIGLIKILISTNCLEEGIDVPSCNLVVRFDSNMNLKSFIQSKGRARQQSSRFFMFSHKNEDKLRILNIKQTNMDLALSYKMRSQSKKFDFTNLINNALNKYKQEESSNPSLKPIQALPLGGIKKREVKWNNYKEGETLIKLFNHPRSDINKEFLNNLLSPFAKVKEIYSELDLVHIAFQKKEKSKEFYNYIDLLKNLNNKKFLNFFFEWNGDLKEEDIEAPEKVPPEKNPVREDPRFLEDVEKELDPFQTDVQIGGFKNIENFVVLKKGWDFGPSKVICNKHNILMDFSEKALRIELYYTMIDGFVIETAEKNGRFAVYLPLQHNPFFYKIEKEIVQQNNNENPKEKNEPEFKLTYSRTCEVTTPFLVLKLVLDAKSFVNLRAILQDRGLKLHGSKAFHIQSKEAADQTEQAFTELLKKNEALENFIYDLRSLLYKRRRFLDTESPSLRFFEMIKELLSNCKEDLEKKTEIFLTLLEQKLNKYFINLEEISANIIEKELPLIRIKPHRKKINKLELPKIKRVIITPTDCIFDGIVLIQSNRVLRKWQNDAAFLLVQFYDEDYSFYQNSEELITNLTNTLNSGISINGTHFKFVSCSNSQLRSLCFWFTSLDPMMIIDDLGDFEKIKNVGKRLARIGLSFGSTYASVRISENAIKNVQKDIKSPKGDLVFSDGIGGISRRGAEMITKILNPLKNPPFSAFQIRTAGFKGVLSTINELSNEVVDDRLSEENIFFRESMKKFNSSYGVIDVVRCSDQIPCFLNRQIILLLLNAGIDENKLFRMASHYLLQLCQIFSNVFLARKYLENLPSSFFSKQFANTITDLEEPFLKIILSTVYLKGVEDLKKKARIPVEKGALLMGVLDDTGTLEYGEVFVNFECEEYDEETHAKKVLNISSQVAVVKNPCLHPGDLRVLKAVSADKVPDSLKNIRGCIVFPSKGSRPHPNEISGSDLDGDYYTVIWDPELVPRPEKISEPMNYSNPAEEKKLPEITLEDIVDFIGRFHANYNLGMIANYHLAVSDAKGLSDPVAISLAELHSIAVDYPKTEVPAEIPKELKPEAYPDFMEKSNTKQTYESTTFIGKLYRLCDALNNLDFSLLNSSLLVKSENKYKCEDRELLENAKQAYEFYKNSILRIQALFGVKTEGEIVSGNIINLSQHLSTQNVFQTTEKIKILYKSLVEELIEVYFLEGDENITQLAGVFAGEKGEYYGNKVKAWYTLTVKEMSENFENVLLSFPWTVLPAYLQSIQRGEKIIKKDLGPGTQEIQISIPEKLNCLLFDNFDKSIQPVLDSFYERLKLVKTIESLCQIVYPNSGVHLFGSSSFFVCEDHSDCDLCLIPRSYSEASLKIKENQIEILKKVYQKILVQFENIRFVENTAVPIIKHDNSEPSFDLGISLVGLKKTLLITEIVGAEPNIFPLLFIAVRWARSSGIINKDKENKNELKLNVFGFLYFFIKFLKKKKIIDINLKKLISEINRKCSEYYAGKSRYLYNCSFLEKFWTKVIDDIRKSSDKFLKIKDYPLSMILVDFMHYCISLEDELEIEDPFREDNCVEIGRKGLSTLRMLSLTTFNFFIIFQSFEYLLVNFTSKSVIKLSKLVMAKIADREAFFSRRINEITGAKVEFKYMKLQSSGDRVLRAIVLGSSQEILKARTFFENLKSEKFSRIAGEGGTRFLENTSTFIFEGMRDERCSLFPNEYNGKLNYNSFLLAEKPNRLCLISPSPNEEWRKSGFIKFRRNLKNQIDLTRNFLLNPEYKNCKIDAYINLGTPVFYNVENWLRRGNSTIAHLEREINRKKRNQDHSKNLKNKEIETEFSNILSTAHASANSNNFKKIIKTALIENVNLDEEDDYSYRLNEEMDEFGESYDNDYDDEEYFDGTEYYEDRPREKPKPKPQDNMKINYLDNKLQINKNTKKKRNAFLVSMISSDVSTDQATLDRYINEKGYILEKQINYEKVSLYFGKFKSALDIKIKDGRIWKISEIKTKCFSASISPLDDVLDKVESNPEIQRSHKFFHPDAVRFQITIKKQKNDILREIFSSNIMYKFNENVQDKTKQITILPEFANKVIYVRNVKKNVYRKKKLGYDELPHRIILKNIDFYSLPSEVSEPDGSKYFMRVEPIKEFELELEKAAYQHFLHPLSQNVSDYEIDKFVHQYWNLGLGLFDFVK